MSQPPVSPAARASAIKYVRNAVLNHSRWQFEQIYKEGRKPTCADMSAIANEFADELYECHFTDEMIDDAMFDFDDMTNEIHEQYK